LQNTNISLLDYLAVKLQVIYVSDLKRMDGKQCLQMRREVEDIPAEEATLFEWNDALAYLTEMLPAETVDEARATLLRALVFKHACTEEFERGDV